MKHVGTDFLNKKKVMVDYKLSIVLSSIIFLELEQRYYMCHRIASENLPFNQCFLINIVRHIFITHRKYYLKNTMAFKKKSIPSSPSNSLFFIIF